MFYYFKEIQYILKIRLLWKAAVTNFETIGKYL